MKKIKTIIIICVALLTGIFIGCGTVSTYASQEKPLKIYKENRNNQIETWKVVDEETGVNYIVVAPRYAEKGARFDGIAITPRYNADGSLYVSE